MSADEVAKAFVPHYYRLFDSEPFRCFRNSLQAVGNRWRDYIVSIPS